MTLTRRQKTVLWALEQGWVAESRKQPTKAFQSRQDAEGGLYIMRAPGASEAAGRYVLRKTIHPLIQQGLAVRLHIPSMDATWVLGMDYYKARVAAFDILTATHPPRTTNHPPPTFSPRFRHRP